MNILKTNCRPKQGFRIAATCLSLSIMTLNAQSSVVTSGGNALGTGGTVSYTIGQTFYVQSQDSQGSAAQGVQQPHITVSNIGISETFLNISLNVFPNPTTGKLTLKISELTSDGLHFIFFDSYGKTIKNSEILSSETTISTIDLANGIYFMNIMHNNETIKTFKIIKN